MSFRYAHLVPAPKRIGQVKPGLGGASSIPANTCFISSFWTPNLKTYRYVRFIITAGAAGNLQAGIYNELFQAVKLSAAQPITGPGKTTVDLGAFSLPAGNYWIALAVDTITNFYGMSGNSLRLGNTSKSCLTSYPLPNTLTIAVPSETVGPNIMLEAA